MPLAGGIMLGIIVIVLLSYIIFKGNTGIAVGLIISTLIFFIAHNKLDDSWTVIVMNVSFPVSFGLLAFWTVFGGKVIIDKMIHND